MWYDRILQTLPILAALVGFTAFAAAQPATASATLAPPLPVPAFPKADADATRVFEEAVRKLDLKVHGPLETTLWQQADWQGLTFRVEGTYLLGPQDHLYLDLKINLGDSEANLQAVCDGTTLWEVIRIGPGDQKAIRKLNLEKMLGTLDSPTLPAEVRNEFFESQALNGLSPLLHSLGRQMTFTQLEKEVSWNGRNTVRLTGVWSPEVSKTIPAFPADKAPFLLWPRQCRLYLDPQTYWPYRIEWWGPAPPRSDNALLMQMEFRNPNWNPPLAPERFTFNPGSAEVMDVTDRQIESAKNRARQLAAEKSQKK